MKLNNYIDHTLLKATANKQDIDTLIQEAITHHFYAVCVNSYWVPYVSDQLKECNVQLASVIGFPLGAMSTAAKVFESKNAVENGADEIDMVINQSHVQNENWDELYQEIYSIKSSIGSKLLKVILETCYLTDKQIVKVSEICMNAGADFIKTSTGFGTGGATLEHVKLMKETVGDHVQIKASGGIRDFETAMAFINLGVSRIGTSSGIHIIKGTISDKSY
ncbi:MAG: deoxyribose-phosphate aldolase [Flavobacteriales bacterium]